MKLRPLAEPRGWLMLLGLACLAMLPLRSAHAAAQSCESFGLDPSIQGRRILERYLEGADGVGGLGCWVHSRPEITAYVVTPHSWGAEPNIGRQGLIDEAFEAFEDSLALLLTLGTLDSDLYLVLSDRNDMPDHPAWTYQSDGDQCWMEVTPRAGFGAWGPEMRRHFKAVVAHETSHCFEYENIAGFPEDGFEAHDRWWSESGATLLQSNIYPNDNHEHKHSAAFDLDGRDFLQPYRAFVFLQQYAHMHGLEDTVRLLDEAYDNSETPETYFEYLDDAEIDETFHLFNFRHFHSSVKDPGGGTFPSEADVSWNAEIVLEMSGGAFEIAPVKPHRLNVARLELPAGYNARFNAAADEGENFHASLSILGNPASDWDAGIEVEGNCHDPVDIPLVLTSLRRRGAEKAEFSYALSEIIDCRCSERRNMPECLPGLWNMDEESVASMLGTTAPTGGRVLTRFFPSGAFTHSFANVDFIQVGRAMTIIKEYRGTLRGCVELAPAGTRPGGGVPMIPENVADTVSRRTIIDHEGVGTTTDKKDVGLENWHWPHTRTYMKCDGNRLYLGRRAYTRVSR